MHHRKNLTGKRVVGVSLLVSVSDVLLNAVVGMLTGSQTILSQSLQGLSDLITAAIVYMGVLRSKRKADKKHPLGYGREIFFWVLIAGMFMFVGTGLVSVLIGIRQIIEPTQITNAPLMLSMLTFGFVTNLYAFSKSRKRLERSAGRKKLSKHFFESAMVETKATFIVDFLGTVSATIGIVSITCYVITGSVAFDGLGSLLVGISMMCAALLLVLDTRALIIGKAIPEQLQKKIRSIVLSHKNVEEIIELRSLYQGRSSIVVLLELHLSADLTTTQIESLCDTIQHAIRTQIPNVYTAQIEVETPNRELK